MKEKNEMQGFSLLDELNQLNVLGGTSAKSDSALSVPDCKKVCKAASGIDEMATADAI